MMTPINGKSEIQKNAAALNLIGYYLKARVSFYNKVARQCRKVETELKKLGDFSNFLSNLNTPIPFRLHVYSSLYQKNKPFKIKKKIPESKLVVSTEF